MLTSFPTNRICDMSVSRERKVVWPGEGRTLASVPGEREVVWRSEGVHFNKVSFRGKGVRSITKYESHSKKTVIVIFVLKNKEGGV